MWLILLLMSVLSNNISSFIVAGNVGPSIKASKGELIPRARVRNVREDFLIVRPFDFQFLTIGRSCDIVEDAARRYRSIMKSDAFVAMKSASPMRETFTRQSLFSRGELSALKINLTNPCERYPRLGTNEKYTLNIIDGVLKAREVWGILRGLETFSQLLTASSDGHLTIKYQSIIDSPRFPHRGLLLDTSRHYLPLSDIMLTLDAMSYNKLNVFHWHIVDDNSFPYVSVIYPEFSKNGAYGPTLIYTRSNIREIIEYARLRGIRVVPEFDTPGHTGSWGLSHPEILTECYENGKRSGKLGPIDPSSKKSWIILEGLFAEIFQAFPDRSIHLGGDEVPYECWSSNPEIMEFMREHGYDDDFTKLESYYFHKLMNFTRESRRRTIVWQEAFYNIPDLNEDTIVQIWMGSWLKSWRAHMYDVVSKNHSAILSSCWYLSDQHSTSDWTIYYDCDPADFHGTPEMKSRVLGGEICMWGEYVDGTNLHQRLWPRASAAAERLWSYEKENNDEFAKRLEEHACRMKRRGIPAQPPNGPGFCVL